MSSSSQTDDVLIRRIRGGEESAWDELISRFEGRLLAFVDSRLRNLAASEDVVQESFIGFLTSLPNFDAKRSLESYLFSIAAHKLTDHLRKEGRRPVLPLKAANAPSDEWDLQGPDRAASSLVRSHEKKNLEEQALVQAMKEVLKYFRSRDDWEKIRCAELLFVRGLPNKQVAAELGITEQTVANCKFDFIARLRSLIRQQGVSEDVFPELYAEELS